MVGVLVQAIHPVLMLRGDAREAGPAPPTPALSARPFPSPPGAPGADTPRESTASPSPTRFTGERQETQSGKAHPW